MYPAAELSALAADKAALCERIGARRRVITELTMRVEEPLRLLDNLRERWERLPAVFKAIAMPLLLALKRVLLPGKAVLRPTLRWVPTLFRLVRMFLQARGGA